jgi:hypothetical protein
LSAERNNAGKLARQLDRRRREATGAPYEGRCSGHDAHYAVVGARHDRPIVVNNSIGNATESATRIGSIDDDRFAGKIGRSRDQRKISDFTHPIESARAAEQLPDHQPVQRRIRQKKPNGRQSVADAVCETHLRARWDDHDWSFAIRKQSPRETVDSRKTASRSDICHHNGERLAIALLSGTQPLDGGFIARVADEMEPAKPL